jgi:8-oxo-dGTP pyrophosphatase MutT (NUDIX family)
MVVENPEEPARGELKEETGLEAAQMTCLGELWIAYGFTRQKQHVYLATGLTHAEKEPDAEEHDLAVRSVSVGEFEEMMRSGVIRDGCTLAAWGALSVVEGAAVTSVVFPSNSIKAAKARS